MKATRRFMSALIAVMMIVSTFAALPTFAEFSDLAKENNAYEAVDVLNKLGIINGYEEDGVVKFKPDNNVTRAEFTAMLLRTRGMGAVGSTSLENPPFPDVVTPDVSWAIGNIRTARELKIINGYDDGTFKPNNNVSYEEAIKMIVCALGYGEMGSEGAFWYTKYLNTAISLGFLEGAGGAVATPATRATIAMMLYNCLEVNLAENNTITDKTILEDDLKLTKNVGYIDSNPEISLSKPDSNLRANEVQIAVNTAGGVSVDTYKVENADEYKDMLGAQITFYYTLDRNTNFKHLIMAQVENSKTIEIEASNLYDFSSSSIEYVKSDDDSRTTTAGISANSVVVYNGKLFGTGVSDSTFAAYCAAKGASAIPSIGKVKLLDRNDDNSYDVVFIDSYDAWVVSSKSTTNYSIVDNVLRKGLADPANKIILHPDNTVFYDAAGNASSFGAISKGGVVCVKTSNAANGGTILQTAIICNNTVSGKVSGTNSNGTVTINGNKYESSKQAPWESVISGATPDTTAPVMGDSGKFYLDCDGNILAFDKTETVSNQQYGYITDASNVADAFENEIKMYIVTKAKPTGKLYTVSDKVKLNGSPVADILAALDWGTEDYNQLVKFTTDSKGQIDEIITAESGGKQEIKEDKLYKHSGVVSTETWTYTKSSKQLSKTVDGVVTEKIYIGSALILKLPANKKSHSSFKTMSVSDFVDGANYKVEVFDVTAAGTAKVVLVYEVPSGAAIGGVKANSPVLFVKEVSIETSEDDIARYILKGYVKGEEASYKLSTYIGGTAAVAPNIKPGDLVKLAKAEDGYYETAQKYVLFSSATAGYRTTAIGYAGGAYPKSELIDGSIVSQIVWGNVSLKEDDRFIVSILEGGTFDMETSWFAKANIYEIDTTKSELDENYITVRTGDGYENILEELQPGTEIFIHMSSASSVQNLIIKR